MTNIALLQALKENPEFASLTSESELKPLIDSQLITVVDGRAFVTQRGNSMFGSFALLKDPGFFAKATAEFDKKIVGEEETRKVIFLCSAGGRLVENAQIASYNLLVNDDAGTGKDYVAGAVLEMLPNESFIHKTRISPTVFTYWHNAEVEPEWTWDGKVFYPEDISEIVLNSDVFKVMCSKGSTATIVKDQKAVELTIKGKPVMITTTASAVPNPELTRRFVILNLDSSQDQTKAIMRRHSEYKKKGIVPEYDMSYKAAMSLLKRVRVRIPFADIIFEFFPSKHIFMRTHYPRFLDYIAASAALHQYQRKRDDDDNVLAEGQDYDIARDCFTKLTSNKYMIPLTINQKKILKKYEDEPDMSGSVSKLHEKMSFLSLRGLQTNLEILVRYGILSITVEKDSLNRDIETYSLSTGYEPNKKMELPTYADVCRNTLVSSASSASITSSASSATRQEGGVTEDVEVTEAPKGLNEVPKCHDCGSDKDLTALPDPYDHQSSVFLCRSCLKNKEVPA